MSYRVIKTDNYDTEIGTVETVEAAIQLIKDFDKKCKYPLGKIEFEIDMDNDGLDAYGSNGRSITLFRTEKINA